MKSPSRLYSSLARRAAPTGVALLAWLATGPARAQPTTLEQPAISTNQEPTPTAPISPTEEDEDIAPWQPFHPPPPRIRAR
mgnify:FL=1